MKKHPDKASTYQKEIEIFAQNVIRLRKERKLTQLKLAELSGLEEKQVGFIEQARRSPNFRTIMALKNGLACQFKDLFKGIGT